MGQGQEVTARRLIQDSMLGGGWVLMQNIHLSLPFCGEAMDLLVETDVVHDSFRLWMTTEVHPQFPIGLLQMAIKFTNEPPQGIRASMKRTYQSITQVSLYFFLFPQISLNFGLNRTLSTTRRRRSGRRCCTRSPFCTRWCRSDASSARSAGTFRTSSTRPTLPPASSSCRTTSTTWTPRRASPGPPSATCSERYLYLSTRFDFNSH
jgi:hypothetical protein